MKGRPVELTPKEFELLAILAGAPGRVFGRGRCSLQTRDGRGICRAAAQCRGFGQLGGVLARFQVVVDRGLRVIARIDRPDSIAAVMLQRGEADGLSFGYRARGYRRLPPDAGGGRVLEDIDLIEVSLVTHPLQHGARVHLVR